MHAARMAVRTATRELWSSYPMHAWMAGLLEHHQVQVGRKAYGYVLLRAKGLQICGKRLETDDQIAGALGVEEAVLVPAIGKERYNQPLVVSLSNYERYWAGLCDADLGHQVLAGLAEGRLEGLGLVNQGLKKLLVGQEVDGEIDEMVPAEAPGGAAA